MTARSIHIGLNRVDPSAYDGWHGQLLGCINDANSMQALASSLGYSTQMLTDGEATSARVLGELAGAASALVSGDILLITYSGHGGQVNDVHGDEPDGLDETWVLYDRQVVDDELYAMWSQFRAGVRIVVVSDSCHSGTVAKMTKTRELYEALTRMARDRPLVSKNMPADLAARVAQRDRAMYDTVQFIAGSSTRQQVLASVLLVSGCQDNQLSYDGDQNGQFTGALLRVWQSGAFQGTYRSFHQRILDEMPPQQSPSFFTTGVSDPAFEAQNPFTIAAPAGVATSTPASSVQRPALRGGASGPDVEYLQTRLTAHGFSTGVDGQFGPGTERQVRAFQSARGLGADGVVGPNTWAALESTPMGRGRSAPPVGAPSTEQYPTLRRGDQGEQVSHLQRRLCDLGYSLKVDGVFGGATESAVRSLQNDHGLPTSGIVDKQTWSVLGVSGAEASPQQPGKASAMATSYAPH